VKVEVKLFAAARQFAGAETVQVELPEGAAVADLRGALIERWPAARSIWQHAMFAVDMEFVGDRERIPPQSEIACIPPVSGG
jgi:molybdopterin converting factor subunit 1